MTVIETLLVFDAIVGSTMRIVKVDHSDPLELHHQVAAEIRRAIAEGEAKQGERLPPAKDLAAVLGVNTNTVLRALATCATRGCSSSGADAASRSPVRPNAEPSSSGHEKLVDFARRQGYRTDELVRIIEDIT